MAPSVHSLVRRAARERLAAARTISDQSKEYHTALAERYARQAEDLAQQLGAMNASKMC